MKKVLVKLNTNPYTCVDIWFTNSRHLFVKQSSKIGHVCSDIDSLAGAVAHNESRSQMVVGIFAPNSSYLVHELGHAVVNLFDYVGMGINIPTTEPFAYMLENLYQQCTDHLNEWSL